MPPKPDAKKQNSGMPLDTFALIEWLDKRYPDRIPKEGQLGTEAYTINLAKLLGKRELIDMLKANADTARRKGG